jgi:DNA-nicking Smr family endonuclease
LHGYTLEEANKIIEKLIIESYLKKIKKIIVVTGKGLHSQNEKNPYVSKELSILKYSIPEFIKTNPDLVKLINKIEEASIEDGGSGAFYIYLKKKQ